MSVVDHGHAAVAAQGSAQPAIIVEGVTKVFRRNGLDTHALDRMDLELSAGEFVSIVGPSGCGKSTLLRIIAGLLPPSEGRVMMNGQVITGPQTNLGIVFQNAVLVDWRTVLGNVLLQTDIRGLPTAQYVSPARALLAAVGLGGFEDRYPYELSGGMRQRAAIVRALIHDPPLLLMDEPFGALDALTREQMRLDLEALWLATKKTVVFITHSVDEAVLLSDRVIVMSPRPGRIERVFTIDLPRPRGLDRRKHPVFHATTEEITGIFLAKGVLFDRVGRLQIAESDG